jgi:hypothetical protein
MTSWPDHLPSGNQKRFWRVNRIIVRADEKLTAFLELEAAIRGVVRYGSKSQAATSNYN